MPATIFAGIASETISELLQRFEHRNFDAGAAIVTQGQPVQEMFVVHAGTASVLLTGATGGEFGVNTIGAGGTIGEMALFTGQPASATVRALGPVQATVIDQSAFRDLADAFPKIYQNLATILSDRLAHTNHHVLSGSQGKVTLLTGRRELSVLAEAIAASVAWHNRLPTALVLIDDDVEPGIEPGMRGPWLEVVLSRSGDAGSTVESLSHRAGNVLAFARKEGSIRADLTIPLLGLDEKSDFPGLRVRAGTNEPQRFRPDSQGELAVSSVNDEERTEISRGYLSNRYPAGRAIGWLARDIAGMKVGFALGAGSVKGYAHFGVLRALEQIGLAPDYLAGTSIGAIIASMVALGIGADKSIEIMEATSSRAFKLTLPTRSLLSDAGVRSNFQMIGGDTRFEDVEIPFAAVAADLADGREVVLRSGLLRTAVLASMAIPGVYPAIRVGGRTLVDGGIVNPVPITAVAGLGADRVVAIPLRDQASQGPIEIEAIESGGKGPGAISNVLRAVEIMQSRIAASVIDSATVPAVFIEPRLSDVTGVSLRSFHQGRPYIEPGERAAREAISALMETFPWLRPLPVSMNR